MTYTPTMLVSQLQQKAVLSDVQVAALRHRLEKDLKEGNYRTASGTAELLADTLRSLASTLEEIQSYDL
jgi:hypothetical protein